MRWLKGKDLFLLTICFRSISSHCYSVSSSTKPSIEGVAFPNPLQFCKIKENSQKAQPTSNIAHVPLKGYKRVVVGCARETVRFLFFFFPLGRSTQPRRRKLIQFWVSFYTLVWSTHRHFWRRQFFAKVVLSYWLTLLKACSKKRVLSWVLSGKIYELWSRRRRRCHFLVGLGHGKEVELKIEKINQLSHSIILHKEREEVLWRKVLEFGWKL